MIAEMIKRKEDDKNGQILSGVANSANFSPSAWPFLQLVSSRRSIHSFASSSATAIAYSLVRQGLAKVRGVFDLITVPAFPRDHSLRDKLAGGFLKGSENSDAVILILMHT
jgi:hypothetical protein